MKTVREQSDAEFLAELNRLGPQTVQDLEAALGVTATAIRQRLSRLQAQEMVARRLVRLRRGRPHYVYQVTEKGLRALGDNYGELALILWRELQHITDEKVQLEVAERVRNALVARLGAVAGTTVAERLENLKEALVARGYDVEIRDSGALPVLRENTCPYHELADEDRRICELEQEVFRRVLGAEVKLAQCCLDGHNGCEFSVQP